ncbi:hypothetical protein I6H88_14285 [Elizabethkingia bruuniana]|uniref:Uncharacterized protein n=1 Tax=Elizabethkingia bruuniana TaxID=1756149 RepID=A0A7T7ZWZ7_9FLAO|nr:hypothetical protein [Elizabethkingia bruuniana]QQN57609.1 hypothetical protein I6H88_14285 [Elizabethkingia bruuniana]
MKNVFDILENYKKIKFDGNTYHPEKREWSEASVFELAPVYRPFAASVPIIHYI